MIVCVVLHNAILVVLKAVCHFQGLASAAAMIFPDVFIFGIPLTHELLQHTQYSDALLQQLAVFSARRAECIQFLEQVNR